MKILIVYASRHGTAAWCAERLQNALTGLDVTAVNLETSDAPDPAEYDAVVFGSSVYYGKLLPSARRFLAEKKEVLLSRPLGLFLCGGLAHEYEYYYEKLLPADLRGGAFRTLYFGGTLRPAGTNLWEKLLLHSMRSAIVENEIDDGEYTPSMPGVLPENVDRMATYLREEIAGISEKSKTAQ